MYNFLFAFMKRILLSASIVLAMVVTANAQSTLTVEEQTQQEVAQLDQLLQMTVSQEQQIYAVALNLNQRLAVVNPMPAGSNKQTALTEISNRRKQSYKGILTSTQMDAYLQANP